MYYNSYIFFIAIFSLVCIIGGNNETLSGLHCLKLELSSSALSRNDTKTCAILVLKAIGAISCTDPYIKRMGFDRR